MLSYAVETYINNLVIYNRVGRKSKEVIKV